MVLSCRSKQGMHVLFTGLNIYGVGSTYFPKVEMHLSGGPAIVLVVVPCVVSSVFYSTSALHAASMREVVVVDIDVAAAGDFRVWLLVLMLLLVVMLMLLFLVSSLSLLLLLWYRVFKVASVAVTAIAVVEVLALYRRELFQAFLQQPPVT